MNILTPPEKLRRDRLMWPVLYLVSPTVISIVLLAAACLLAWTANPHPLLAAPAAGAVGALVGMCMFAVIESDMRRRAWAAWESRVNDTLTRVYLRQRADGMNATDHVDGCRCTYVMDRGKQMLVTLAPCKRVKW